ncbi:hypothetical protein SAMN05216257_102570 [Meinhardsimonia xiamenensis]|jgi:transcriptional regulator with XRE-family HTH domain|uniref:HTH cro/C1-type domain-containing protein n=1 Tax=Meinhardsimonia xiamenensis TaxID=990712 RepID=A0A1G9BJE6_9RHOB|nr:helix-turn-helix transcriptional regulator [Meinhardsimonia xiamenensis]PRX34956.1 hypothetical protein LV81_01549 [Meinhardsimonia xiamenensis]SDK39649.1 hypothetical protein SAMN05216257_102570 [Meinhardsimonia xiamenensis]
MHGEALTGSRIRARRSDLGLRQAELARRVGISASYLNLIEHNRRRIGGKLLIDIAAALGVEPAALTEAAGPALVESLLAAADAAARSASPPETAAETGRVEEFAGRFRGWAELIAHQARRLDELERTVELLSDRLNHDPFLSTAMHDVLDTASALRATAQILAETPDIEPEWRERFQRNLVEDSARLAEAARGLADWLDRAGGTSGRAGASPQDELGAWLEARGHHLPEIEGAAADEAGALAEALLDGSELSPSARALARAHLERYRRDAEALPLPRLASSLAEIGPDLPALTARLEADPALVMRRLATLPEDTEVPGGRLGPVGLAVADASGTLLQARAVEGFTPPRFGAACPLWPLFEALSRPMSPVHARLEFPGAPGPRFAVWAISQPVAPPRLDLPPLFESTMLVLPERASREAGAGSEALPLRPVGTSCRICPREGCPARREPSLLGPARDAPL